jgi:hypothetical protein
MSNLNLTSKPMNPTFAKASRFPIWLRIIAVMIMLAVIFGGVMTLRMSYVPNDLDFATTRLSDQNLFRGAYTVQSQPISIGTIHTWILHLETAEGKPVEDAQISVDGGMPQHGHGLPTAPKVTKYLGSGDYRVEGMKFNMTGWWVVKFKIDDHGTADTVIFNLSLN